MANSKTATKTAKKATPKTNGIAKVKQVLSEVLTPEPEVIAPEVLPAAPVIITNIVDEKGALQSHSLKRKGITYPSPQELLSGISLLQGASSIEVKAESEIEITNGTQNNIAYQRLYAIANYNVDEDINYKVGILVALDLTSPKIKVFSGAEVKACLNEMVFNFDTCEKYDLQSDKTLETIQNTVSKIQQRIEAAKRVILQLKSTPLNTEQVETLIGKMYIKNLSSFSNFGNDFFKKGVDQIADPKNKYYYNVPNFSAWHLVNAFTENIKVASIFDRAEKSKDALKLMNNYLPFMPNTQLAISAN